MRFGQSFKAWGKLLDCGCHYVLTCLGEENVLRERRIGGRLCEIPHTYAERAAWVPQPSLVPDEDWGVE